MNGNFSGTGVALITPFKSDLSIDFEALKRITERCITGGCEFLVILGTTGESVVLSAEEKSDVIKTILNVNKQRVPAVLGIGGNDTASVIKQLKSIPEGIDAILSVTPYYNKPSQEGLFQHYKAVCEASPLPIILYNVPGRTGVNMTADTTLRIINACSNAIAIKEASGNADQCFKIMKNAPEGFVLLSGDDNMTLPLVALGATGVISTVANSVPATYSEMVRQAIAGNFAEARRLHRLTFELVNQIFADGSPAGVKEALAHQGLCHNRVRLPLANVNATVAQNIKQQVDLINE